MFSVIHSFSVWMIEWINWCIYIIHGLQMGRLTAQVLSDSHSHRLIDGSLAWIASDYLLSWCEIDTILISQTKQTFSFKVCQKVVRLFWKLLLIDVTSVVFYNALIYDIVPGLSQYLVQIDAHTLIPRIAPLCDDITNEGFPGISFWWKKCQFTRDG